MKKVQQINAGCNALIFIDFHSFHFIFWQIEKLNKILMIKQPIAVQVVLDYWKVCELLVRIFIELRQTYGHSVFFTNFIHS